MPALTLIRLTLLCSARSGTIDLLPTHRDRAQSRRVEYWLDSTRLRPSPNHRTVFHVEHGPAPPRDPSDLHRAAGTRRPQLVPLTWRRHSSWGSSAPGGQDVLGSREAAAVSTPPPTRSRECGCGAVSGQPSATHTAAYEIELGQHRCAPPVDHVVTADARDARCIVGQRPRTVPSGSGCDGRTPRAHRCADDGCRSSRGAMRRSPRVRRSRAFPGTTAPTVLLGAATGDHPRPRSATCHVRPAPRLRFVGRLLGRGPDRCRHPHRGRHRRR